MARSRAMAAENQIQDVEVEEGDAGEEEGR